MTTNTINTEAILTNAGRVLSTRRIHTTMQRICKANGHSRRVFTASRETNTERFGKNWARLIAAHHTDIHRAEGIDWMLQDLLGPERSITGALPYENGHIRGENPDEYIDRDHLARWAEAIKNAGVDENGHIDGCDTKAPVSIDGMTWEQYLLA